MHSSSCGTGVVEAAGALEQRRAPGGPCRRARLRRPRPRAPRRRASSPNHCGGPGISRSSPAFAAGAVLCVPYQSDITTPSKPHSSRSIASSAACSLQYVPWTRLYAAMTAHVPASRTAASNGTSEISRSVRSSTSELIVMRSNSESLATKCLTVHADTLRLHAGDVRDRDARREVRVLGVALEVAARERMAVDVDGRREQRVRLLALASRRRAAARPRARARGSTLRRARCRTGSSPTAAPTTARPARRSARRSPSAAGTPSRATPGPCHRSTPATSAAFSSRVSSTSFDARSCFRSRPRAARAPLAAHGIPASSLLRRCRDGTTRRQSRGRHGRGQRHRTWRSRTPRDRGNARGRGRRRGRPAHREPQPSRRRPWSPT